MEPYAFLELLLVLVRHGKRLATAFLLKDGSGDDDSEVVHDLSLILIVEETFGDKVVSPYIVEQL